LFMDAIRKKLRINWIMARANLSGGTKSNRLIAEAMVRRGHQVNIAYVDGQRAWPRLWQTRSLWRRLRLEMNTWGRNHHHLEHSTANLIPVKNLPILHQNVPDADVSMATWWLTREWIEGSPTSKGIKAYFIRHHELHGGDPERVAATYRLNGLKFMIAKWLQQVMAEEYDDPEAVLVPNGVDWAQSDSLPRDRHERPSVGMLYGWQEWKGAATAFDSLRLAKKQFPNLRAVAFGPKPLAAVHNPPSWLEFHLRPSQGLIPELYQQTDCWIVPSTTEGFGMPGLEAAACHCPIVSTLSGGPQDYIENGVSGFLVPVGDPKAMADAVCRVLDLPNDRWRRMSKASYDIAKRFDWDKSAEILERSLLRALSVQDYPLESAGT
jgi:glycosyltransferase involved in cell wall biosynthesis